MPILDGDIKLLKSESIADVDEAGGLPTANVVVDGQSNNLFSDISELDRTYGRISLAKVFPAVVTDDTDAYLGSHIIVAAPPADPKVSATLFTTGSWSDKRIDAQGRLESYLALGTETRLSLYGNHLAGQRVVQAHCSAAAPSPGIGDVLALVNNLAPAIYQYVRITRIISRLAHVFTDQYGDYTRDVIQLEVSDPLRYGFTAAGMTRYSDAYYNPPTRIYNTFPADATAYYGIAPLAEVANLGALTLRVNSIYSQLVPSALSEAPIVDARCTSDRETIVPISGAAALSFIGAISTGPGEVAIRYFGSGVARGSLSIDIGGATLVDDWGGNLVPSGGFYGTVDYATGAVALARATGFTGSGTYTAQPAVSVAAAGHTASTPITIANRGYNYVRSLLPVPAPGSVSIDYMAVGKWYRLYDNGAGAITGDDGIGTGSIDYATGSLVVTLGALPDANTEIIFAWGSPAHYDSHVGAAVFSDPTIRIDIPGGALEPGQLSLTYTAGAVTRTVTDNGNGGLAGDGTGSVNYASGRVALVPSFLPDGATAVGVSYKQGMANVELNTASGAALTSFTLAHAVEPKSLSISFTDNASGRYFLTDDGAGLLVYRSADLSEAWKTSDNVYGLVVSANKASLKSTAGIYGTINYATGAVSLNGQAQLYIRAQSTPAYANGEGGWHDTVVDTIAAGTITATYRQDNDTAGATQTLNIPAPVVTLDLLPAIANAIVAGSLRIVLGGQVYVDRAGVLVKDPAAATNSGTTAGTINYATGVATLDGFQSNVAPSASVICLTRRGIWKEWQLKFRVSGAPIQPASLALRASRASDSVQVTASSALNGDISGAADGTVDFQFGIVSVKFGAWVADAGLSPAEKLEWWYDAGNVVGGQVFRPEMVFPETARFNAVAVSNLPLSSVILGLDPVRLPVDGRVPILRKGDVLVVHHTAVTSPANVSNGQTVNLSRVRLARVRVIDSSGATISTGYTPNLDAGTITFSSIAGYNQPVTIEHRIEDAVLCSDAQINGDLAITRPLTHDYPLGSYVSSALVLAGNGTLGARPTVFFDQQTLAGWSDTLQGSPATGTYNKALYPIELTNRGCLEERWEILFTNTGIVSVIGETVGQILTGHAIVNDLAPINPATGTPYFTLRALGWGSGWSAGNVLRFNTRAANYPVWVARTVLQGNAAVSSDRFVIGIRGDVNT